MKLLIQSKYGKNEPEETSYSDNFYAVESPQLLHEIYPPFNLGMEENLSLNLIGIAC